MILEFKKRSLAGGVIVLEIKGNIHCGPECARLERQADELVAAGETLAIFDMSGVTYADSAAIGSIVKCFSKLKGAGGMLKIAGAQSMIEYSLKLTKVDRVIEMLPTVEQAAKRFSEPQTGASQQA